MHVGGYANKYVCVHVCMYVCIPRLISDLHSYLVVEDLLVQAERPVAGCSNCNSPACK